MFLITRVPVYGEISEDVRLIQRRLTKEGFDPGPDDSIFLDRTKAAIIDLQKKLGLEGTGGIGPRTLDALSIEVRPVIPDTGSLSITRDKIGKRDRRVHPTMRVMIEKNLFPNGKIGKAWLDRDIRQCMIDVCVAMEKIKIVESGGNNRGREVGMIQDIIGGYVESGDGAAWCLSLAQHPIAIVEDFFQVESPVIDSEHCTTTAAAAQKIAGLTTQTCESGTIALAKHGAGPSGHAMAVVAVLANGQMKTYEGNTSIANIRDGDASGFRTRDQKRNGDLTTICFVRAFPNNKLPEV